MVLFSDKMRIKKSAFFIDADLYFYISISKDSNLAQVNQILGYRA